MQFNYKEQLADSRWLQKKAEILIRDNYTCQKCGATSHLNVHHLSYEIAKLAWEYPNENFITLCQNCHENTHFNQNVEALNGINRGNWYYAYFGDFRSYAVVFDIDYTTKTIYLFGSNEGSWGSAWIYAVKHKDFVKRWCAIDIFESDEEDEIFAHSYYFLGGFIEAFDELMNGHDDVYMGSDSYAVMLAQHYMPYYINKYGCFVEYCNYRKIKCDY